MRLIQNKKYHYRLIYLFLIGMVLGLDQLFKLTLPMELNVPWGGGYGGWWLAGIGLLIIGLGELIYRRQSSLVNLATALVLGGWFSNTIDIWWRGKVVDYWPIKILTADYYTNLADLIIWLGIVVVLIELLKTIQSYRQP